MHLCPRIVFPFEKQISHELLLDLVKKTKQLYTLSTLAKCHFTIQALICGRQKVDTISLHWLSNF
jgi:hypothetical protein